jgi:glycosyltransferase involved in cell wall biosynthesis
MSQAAPHQLRRLRLAILGTRGIPGGYGGFETFAEEIGTRLAADGHDVFVYCRHRQSRGSLASYRGVRLVHLPAIRHKSLETLSHTLLSALHACLRRYDIVYVCNSANAPICFIPWMRRQKVILNVDGLEWQRQKWGRLAKRYFRWAARLAARMPIEIVTDAAVIQQYYREHYGRSTRCIGYGTETFPRGHLADRLPLLGLKPESYVLYVSRLEPENNALLVVEAYQRVVTDLPLVIVGDAPYAADYIARVRDAADERVRFLGYRFGDEYHALQANARVYIQATEVGGTHPALVEAMGHRNAILAQDVPEHHEVLAAAGHYFSRQDSTDLAQQLQLMLGDERLVEQLRAAAAARVQEHYTWQSVTDAYRQYFAELVA